ncbi:unnamed protein product [Camellia sinensis]
MIGRGKKQSCERRIEGRRVREAVPSCIPSPHCRSRPAVAAVPQSSRRPTVAIATVLPKKKASSSIDNTNLRLKPRFCNCGRIAYVRIVRTNANGNKGRVYFVCPRKYDSNDHCNYFRWFADDDDDDDDTTSSIRANAGPRTDSRIEQINDLRTRLGEHDRRLQRIENILK